MMDTVIDSAVLGMIYFLLVMQLGYFADREVTNCFTSLCHASHYCSVLPFNI
jgi:hypothetical protein